MTGAVSLEWGGRSRASCGAGRQNRCEKPSWKELCGFPNQSRKFQAAALSFQKESHSGPPLSWILKQVAWDGGCLKQGMALIQEESVCDCGKASLKLSSQDDCLSCSWVQAFLVTFQLQPASGFCRAWRTAQSRFAQTRFSQSCITARPGGWHLNGNDFTHVGQGLMDWWDFCAGF